MTIYRSGQVIFSSSLRLNFWEFHSHPKEQSPNLRRFLVATFAHPSATKHQRHRGQNPGAALGRPTPGGNRASRRGGLNMNSTLTFDVILVAII